jgi:hypothetical protein
MGHPAAAVKNSMKRSPHLQQNPETDKKIKYQMGFELSKLKWLIKLSITL